VLLHQTIIGLEAKEQLGSEGLTARTAGENALDVDFEILKTAIRRRSYVEKELMLA